MDWCELIQRVLKVVRLIEAVVIRTTACSQCFRVAVFAVRSVKDYLDLMAMPDSEFPTIGLRSACGKALARGKGIVATHTKWLRGETPPPTAH